MAAIAGYAGNVKLGATGGTNVVAQVKLWEIPLAADMYDVSVLGTNWKAYLPGLIGSEVKLDVFLDPTDTTGQIALYNAMTANPATSVIVNLYTTASHYYSGTAFIKGFDIKDPVNAPLDASLVLVFSGAIAYT